MNDFYMKYFVFQCEINTAYTLIRTDYLEQGNLFNLCNLFLVFVVFMFIFTFKYRRMLVFKIFRNGISVYPVFFLMGCLYFQFM